MGRFIEIEIESIPITTKNSLHRKFFDRLPRKKSRKVPIFQCCTVVGHRTCIWTVESSTITTLNRIPLRVAHKFSDYMLFAFNDDDDVVFVGKLAAFIMSKRSMEQQKQQ